MRAVRHAAQATSTATPSKATTHRKRCGPNSRTKSLRSANARRVRKRRSPARSLELADADAHCERLRSGKLEQRENSLGVTQIERDDRAVVHAIVEFRLQLASVPLRLQAPGEVPRQRRPSRIDAERPQVGGGIGRGPQQAVEHGDVADLLRVPDGRRKCPVEHGAGHDQGRTGNCANAPALRRFKSSRAAKPGRRAASPAARSAACSRSAGCRSPRTLRDSRLRSPWPTARRMNSAIVSNPNRSDAGSVNPELKYAM